MYINKSGCLIEKLESNNVSIVHLDDHALFRDALKFLIDENFKKINLFTFNHGDDALDFICAAIRNGERIDLIIMDFNHPGSKGDDLALSIRCMEGIFKRRRIPIIILSMMSTSGNRSLLTGSVVNAWLTKDTRPKEIVACIKGMIGSKGFY